MNAGEKKNNHKKDRTKTTKKDRTTTAAADAAKAHVEDQGDDAKDKAWLLACANISMITCPLVAAFVGVFLNLSNEIETDDETAASHFNDIAVNCLKINDEENDKYIDKTLNQYTGSSCEQLVRNLSNEKLTISYQKVSDSDYVATATPTTLLVLESDADVNPTTSTTGNYYELIAIIQGGGIISLKPNLVRDRISSNLVWGTFEIDSSDDMEYVSPST